MCGKLSYAMFCFGSRGVLCTGEDRCGHAWSVSVRLVKAVLSGFCSGNAGQGKLRRVVLRQASHGLSCNGKSGRGKVCHAWERRCSRGFVCHGQHRHVLAWWTEVSYGRSPNGSQKRRDGGEKTERRECMKVINSWKIEKYPVSADAAKAEFDRIYEKYGELTTSAVVDESRDEMSVLHNCFEWDDEIAAERFRQRQAGDMIRCLVSVVVPDEEKQPLIVRAIVKTTERYEPISVAMRSEEKTAVLLQDALADIRRFKQKHGALKQLAGVFEEMQKFEDNILNGGAA